MSTVYNDPIMLDSTGQDIVTKLDSIASLMGDGVIDDTSTTATDKTWSASKENTVVNGLQSNVIANTKLIKDTVGWSGKNKFGGLSFTDTRATHEYNPNTGYCKIICASAKGQTFIAIDATPYRGMTLTFSITSFESSNNAHKPYVAIYKNANTLISNLGGAGEGIIKTKAEVIVPNDANTLNFLFRIDQNDSDTTGDYLILNGIMLKDADILDPTYEPYFGSTAFPRSEQAVLGAKNIIPYPYHSPNSYTSHDVGFTVNTNKTITTDNGTASGDDAVFTLLQKSDTAFNDFFELTKGKTIKLTGVPEGASTSTYWLMIYDTSAHNLVSGEMEYQMPETMPSAFYLQIVVKNGQSASNKIWKPMISFDGGEYVPPAMTNKELTDKVAFNNVEITNVNAGITLDTAWSYAYQVGNLVMYALRFTVGASAIAENTILCSFGAECSKSMNADILPRQTGNHFLAALVADTTNHRTDFKTFGGATLTASNEYLVSGIYIAK